VPNENGYSDLLDKTAYKTAIRSWANQMIQQMGQEERKMLNQQLKSAGFSSVDAYLDAYLDYGVNEDFANKTNVYSFSTDETALFLEKALPKNIGTNEFSGQTYYGLTWDSSQQKEVKDMNRKYVFTASGYTYTYSYNGTVSETITGSYAFDSNQNALNNNQKRVWLKPKTKNGKDRSVYYAEQTAYSGHYFADDNAYRAAQTNEAFDFGGEPYNSTNKTIGRED
jgi:small-conductance mechanosensitive channel